MNNSGFDRVGGISKTTIIPKYAAHASLKPVIKLKSVSYDLMFKNYL